MSESTIELLKQVFYLQDLPSEQLEYIASHAERRHYKPGEVIVDEADTSREFFIILTGSIEISKKVTDNADDQRQQFFGRRGSGDIFGEMALLDGKPRSARATATTFTQLLAINDTQFESLVREHPRISLAIMRGLSYRLRESNQLTIKELQKKNKELANLNADLEKKVINRTTELHQRNEELEILNKKKDEFLRIAAHDLRNPIAVIHGYAQMSSLIDVTEEFQKEILQETVNHCENMLAIINGLLDIAAMESGKLQLNLALVELNELIDEKLNGFKVVAGKKSINVVTDLEPTVPPIWADPTKIGSVLENLVSNAIKFSYPNTTITIRSSVDEDYCIIQVSDQGLGMSADDINKAFNEFQKLSARPTNDEPSNGLGLAIVKKLIELHGGSVWIESEGQGQGATFSFRLPISNDAEL